MNRKSIFELDDGEPGTFANDENLPALPLPSLDDTLDRYYESLRPFGSAEQLQRSRAIIEQFRTGVGRQLHALVEQRAARDKNWVERWWEDYAYCTIRDPLVPNCNMQGCMPFDHTRTMRLDSSAMVRNLARITHASIAFWDLIRRERVRPSTNPSGTVTYSSFLLKRVYNTFRVPGERMDRIVSHFRTLSQPADEQPERRPSAQVIVLGAGRMWAMDVLDEHGLLISVQTVAAVLGLLYDRVLREPAEQWPVPILTCDNRSSWAANRERLIALTPGNRRTLDLVERAIGIVSLDTGEPGDFTAQCLATVGGDLQSRWADTSSMVIGFRNGRVSCGGEHACYDGTISIAFMMYAMMQVVDEPEPDWSAEPLSVRVPAELRFELDDGLRTEIGRVWSSTNAEKQRIMMQCGPMAYGKAFLKQHRLHPDSFVQMLFQLVYFRLHGDFVASYETALMRNYYNGRTETLRSCNLEATEWVKAYLDGGSDEGHKVRMLRRAVDRHNEAMTDVRNGRGIDRHLFAMWCAAYEADMDIPALYDDELYARSGGGGNFVLSTSTLGYTLCCGFVMPMCRDGYGLFYSITDEVIFLHVSAYRDSDRTSAQRFSALFADTMSDVRELIERTAPAKL